MTLSEFLQQFCHNSIIRVLYKPEFERGYAPANKTHDWDVVAMDHEIINGKGVYGALKDMTVVKVIDLHFDVSGEIKYSHAINIVINGY